jgi:hypothetical protein
VLAGCASQALVIRDDESGKRYGKWPAPEGTEFAVEFVHSVNATPVRDVFIVAPNGKIRAVASYFRGFGAGIQTGLEAGEKLERAGDNLVIVFPSDDASIEKGLGREYAELRYIVGTVSDHLFFIGGKEISLRELCGRNAHIVIKVK